MTQSIILTHFFLWKGLREKFVKKVWVLAPTTLKSMGAEAPTAPILTGALIIVNQILKIFIHFLTRPKLS